MIFIDKKMCVWYLGLNRTVVKTGRGAHHHQQHHRLTSFFHATARVRRFPRMPFLHTARSCVSLTQALTLTCLLQHTLAMSSWAYHGLCHLHFQLLYVCMLTPNHLAAYVPHVQPISFIAIYCTQAIVCQRETHGCRSLPPMVFPINVARLLSVSLFAI